MIWVFLRNRLTWYVLGAVVLGGGLWWWHNARVAAALEAGKAEGRSAGYNEYRTSIYEPEVAKYEARIIELETNLVELSKVKRQVVESIRVIERNADTERETVGTISDVDTALADIRQRLRSIAATQP